MGVGRDSWPGVEEDVSFKSLEDEADVTWESHPDNYKTLSIGDRVSALVFST